MLLPVMYATGHPHPQRYIPHTTDRRLAGPANNHQRYMRRQNPGMKLPTARCLAAISLAGAARAGSALECLASNSYAHLAVDGCIRSLACFSTDPAAALPSRWGQPAAVLHYHGAKS